MSKGMIGKLPLHVWREPRDVLDNQLIGSEGAIVLHELKKFVKFEHCWTGSGPKPTSSSNGERSIGMFGLLPLKSMQGTLNTLDQLGAGPKGDLVRLELLKFVDRKPCWTKSDEAIVVRNRHGHVVITVTGLRLRGDEEVDRLQAVGHEVTERAIRYFCSDKEHNIYTADHLLQQDRKYTVVLIPRSEITAKVTSNFDAMQYLHERLAKKFDYHVPLAGITPRLCEAIPDEVLDHLGIDRVLVVSNMVYPEHESYSRGAFGFSRDKKGHRVVDVDEDAWGTQGWDEPDFPYGNSTAFAFFVEPVKKPSRKYVESVKLNDKDADKALQNGTIIRVNRKIVPAYPNWVMRVVHPELENIGPEEYDLVKVEKWLHETQQKGDKRLRLLAIYEYLKIHNMLEHCLGLRDGEEMMKKGHKVFQQLFGQGKKTPRVFLWKSVVEFRKRLDEEAIKELRFRNVDARGMQAYDDPVDAYEVHLRVPYIYGVFDMHFGWAYVNGPAYHAEDPALMYPEQ